MRKKAGKGKANLLNGLGDIKETGEKNRKFDQNPARFFLR